MIQVELEHVAEKLADVGWVVLPGFMPLVMAGELREQAQAQRAAGGFHAAGIGRGQGPNVNATIRGDEVRISPEITSFFQVTCGIAV